ncbi:hypothetical protein DV735_g1405, partial [Chaetothyriales sp. CBS 134920]
MSPFDTSVLPLKLPQLQDDSDGSTLIWQGFHLDCRLENETFSLPDVKEERLPELETGLFDLKLNEDTALTPVDAPSSVSDYTTADEDREEERRPSEPATTTDGGIEDVWILPEVTLPTKDPILNSWDTFLKGLKEEDFCPAYLSEAKPRVFDAVIQATCNTPVKRVQPDYFLNALWELALGRNSGVFVWDEQASNFTQTVEAFTVTGFAPGTIQAVVEDFKTGAAIFRRLQRQQGPSGGRRADTIAFDAVLRSCLLSIEAYMELQRPHICSVLSLRRVFEGPLSMLQICQQLSGVFQDSQTTAVRLHSLFDHCVALSMQQPQFRPLINQVLAAVSEPTLRQLGAALGLGLGLNTGRYATVETETVLHNVFAQSKLLQIAQETHESLCLLDKVASERLAAATVPGSDGLLRLAFSWAELDSLQQDASRYEEAARSRMQGTAKGEVSQHDTITDRPDTESNSKDEEADKDMGLLLPHLDSFSSELLPKDDVQNVALDCLMSPDNTNSLLAVPLSEVLDLSLSPFICAQHRLLSYSLLNTLFCTYRFSSHLHMLRQIHLFGNGMFTARLSMALFDSHDNDVDGDNPMGDHSTTTTPGLRLQTRDSWPPASSELRLVLMGILSDSLQDTTSFAIRELADDELEACRDINSIHALDFLKLQYKPANALLEAVLMMTTPPATTADKYDAIFRHMLRVLRLKSVAQMLLRQESEEAPPQSASTAEEDAMHSLETLFNLILEYAQSQRHKSMHRHDGHDDDTNTNNFRAQFHHHVRRFIDLVKTVAAAPREGGKGEDEEGDESRRIEPLAHLVLVLDFNGYWK